MLLIMLNGALGKMGFEFAQVVKQSADLDVKIVAGIDVKKEYNSEMNFNFSISDNFPDDDVDVIVDFSNPSALNKILNFAESKKVAVVLATTGYSSEQINQIKKASKNIPIFFSFNMSIGINLLVHLVKKIRLTLGDSFDIEILEKHHNQKIDAPSGTALMIADALNSDSCEPLKYVYDRHISRKKRQKNEIGIHSVRGGTIVGEHEVIFAGKDEIITIGHVANSKKVFAQGALRAAMFVKNKPAGLYDMNDLIR